MMIIIKVIIIIITIAVIIKNNNNDNGLLNGAHEMARHLSKLSRLLQLHEIKWIETDTNCKIKLNK